jgi:hypothetical protein
VVGGWRSAAAGCRSAAATLDTCRSPRCVLAEEVSGAGQWGKARMPGRPVLRILIHKIVKGLTGTAKTIRGVCGARSTQSLSWRHCPGYHRPLGIGQIACVRQSTALILDTKALVHGMVSSLKSLQIRRNNRPAKAAPFFGQALRSSFPRRCCPSARGYPSAVAAGALLTTVVNTTVPEAVEGEQKLAGMLAVAGLLAASCVLEWAKLNGRERPLNQSGVVVTSAISGAAWRYPHVLGTLRARTPR